MIIGMFIIYNSFAIAITQRRPEIGILRALGATRSQIRRLFLPESLIAAVRLGERAKRRGIDDRLAPQSTQQLRSVRVHLCKRSPRPAR